MTAFLTAILLSLKALYAKVVLAMAWGGLNIQGWDRNAQGAGSNRQHGRNDMQGMDNEQGARGKPAPHPAAHQETVDALARDEINTLRGVIDGHSNTIVGFRNSVESEFHKIHGSLDKLLARQEGTGAHTEKSPFEFTLQFPSAQVTAAAGTVGPPIVPTVVPAGIFNQPQRDFWGERLFLDSVLLGEINAWQVTNLELASVPQFVGQTGSGSAPAGKYSPLAVSTRQRFTFVKANATITINTTLTNNTGAAITDIIAACIDGPASLPVTGG